MISNGRQQFLLSKRENAEIDICLADANYAFSIDAKFESDLNKARIAIDRRQVFRDYNVVPAGSRCLRISCGSLAILKMNSIISSRTRTRDLGFIAITNSLLRIAHLSANVLICLFGAVVQAIDPPSITGESSPWTGCNRKRPQGLS